jgi:hypothetical protein
MSTNQPENSEALPLTTCSPYLTPETDEAWKAVSRTPDGMYDSRVPISAYAYAMYDHSKKMERQRDELRDAVRAYPDRECEHKYAAAGLNTGRCIKCDTVKHFQTNAIGHAPGEKGTTNE